MKTQRRHELHTNVLADWLGKHLETIQPIVGWVVAGVVVIVLAILAWSYFSGRSETQMLDGWTAIAKYGTEATNAANSNDTPGFNDATRNLAKVVTDYSGTSLAMFAEATLADVLLARGQSLMWTNRPEALQNLKEAVAKYNSAIDATDEPLLKNRLRMNLGTTYEWMFQVEDAKRAYQQVEGIYQPAAAEAIAALENATAQQLFERLEKFQPAPQQKPNMPEAEFGKPEENIFDRIPDFKQPDDGTGATTQPTGTAPVEKGADASKDEKSETATEPAAQGTAAAESPAK